MTCKPLTSTVLSAVAGSIFDSTAAILPPRMATSRISLMLVPGIDDMSAAEQEVVLRLREGSPRQDEDCEAESLREFHAFPRVDAWPVHLPHPEQPLVLMGRQSDNTALVRPAAHMACSACSRGVILSLA